MPMMDNSPATRIRSSRVPTAAIFSSQGLSGAIPALFLASMSMYDLKKFPTCLASAEASADRLASSMIARIAALVSISKAVKAP